MRSLTESLAAIANQLRAKGRVHWITALVLTAVGVAAGQYFSTSPVWTSLRYRTFQWSMRGPYRRAALYPKRTVLVLVGDEEYWKGPFEYRSPINREQVAALLSAVDAGDPRAIAIDFDLRDPVSDPAFKEPEPYTRETATLVSVVRQVAQRRVVVLPTTMERADDGSYHERPNVYGDLNGPNIQRGYIQLPFDLRRVPAPRTVEKVGSTDTEDLDSFSSAIVKSVDPVAYNRVVSQGEEQLPFGRYMTKQEMEGAPGSPNPTLLWMGDVLKMAPQQLRDDLQGKIVILGGAWSERAYHQGATIDLQDSPVGAVSGAYLHTNYVEAMLANETFGGASEQFAIIAEILLVGALAILLALELAAGWKLVAALSSTALFIVICNFLLQNLGIFLDFIVPLFVLCGHLAMEKILHWRHAGLAHKRAAGA